MLEHVCAWGWEDQSVEQSQKTCLLSAVSEAAFGFYHSVILKIARVEKLDK